jgi:hypothetical protein
MQREGQTESEKDAWTPIRSTENGCFSLFLARSFTHSLSLSAPAKKRAAPSGYVPGGSKTVSRQPASKTPSAGLAVSESASGSVTLSRRSRDLEAEHERAADSQALLEFSPGKAKVHLLYLHKSASTDANARLAEAAAAVSSVFVSSFLADAAESKEEAGVLI